MPKISILLLVSAVTLARIPAAVCALPKVVETHPENGAVNVDPATKEIRVKFDQPMAKGMSVVGGGEKFPEIVGKPTWANNRTITIRVKLQPNHDYWLSINNARFQNFTNAGGEAATPYPIQFRTGGAGAAKHSSATGSEAAENADATANRRAFEQLQTAVRDYYSYRDRLPIDWNKLFKSADASLIAAKSPDEFARLAATMLAQAKDKHIWLQIGDETVPTYVNPSVVNANYKLLRDFVPQFKPQGRASLAVAGTTESAISASQVGIKRNWVMVRNYSRCSKAFRIRRPLLSTFVPMAAAPNRWPSGLQAAS